MPDQMPHQDGIEPLAPPPSTTTEDIPSVSSAPDRRISPEDAAQAEAKKVQSWIETMDALEASVVDQGRYFAKFGEKSDDPNEDSRALVLIEPIITPGTPPTKKGLFQKPQPGTPEKKSWVVITRDGPKIVNVRQGDTRPGVYDTFENRQAHFAQLIKDYTQDPDNVRETEYASHVRDGYTSPYVDSNENPRLHLFEEFVPAKTAIGWGRPDLERNDADPEIVQDAIRKSIESSESPHKARVEAADKSAKAAKDATAMVTSLPPRS